MFYREIDLNASGSNLIAVAALGACSSWVLIIFYRRHRNAGLEIVDLHDRGLTNCLLVMV
jgi:hypothetical protein